MPERRATLAIPYDAEAAAAPSTVDQLNLALGAYGIRLPAQPTPEQIGLARVLLGLSQGVAAQRAADAALLAEREALGADPGRIAAYEAARASCFFDTEARFPGWVPQPLSAADQRDAELVATLSLEAPPWAYGDPVVAAIRGEASRLLPLSRGRSAEARAIRAEISRLEQAASRLGRQESSRRRREAPGAWARVDPWPTTCQICGQPIDPSVRWPDPLSESLGHEPPISWTLRHLEYDGPRLLRPEHLACNIAKGARPDAPAGR